MAAWSDARRLVPKLGPKAGATRRIADVIAGLWIAGRLGAIHYQDLEGGASGPAPWDHDVRRTQFSAGYRIARNLEAKAEWMQTDMEGPLDTRDDLVSMQLWWAY